MKTRITLAVAVLAVLLMAFTAVALAAVTSKGTLTRFTYSTSTKVGKLTVTAKKKTVFRVPSGANCGIDKGQSGDQIPCKSLGKSKYSGKPVRVTSTKNSSGVRTASLVVVVMH